MALPPHRRSRRALRRWVPIQGRDWSPRRRQRELRSRTSAVRRAYSSVIPTLWLAWLSAWCASRERHTALLRSMAKVALAAVTNRPAGVTATSRARAAADRRRPSWRAAAVDSEGIVTFVAAGHPPSGLSLWMTSGAVVRWCGGVMVWWCGGACGAGNALGRLPPIHGPRM